MPKTPPPAMPMRRDEWVAEFADAAVRLWPEVGFRHASTVGLSRSTGALATDPAKAARKWVEEANGSAIQRRAKD